MGEAPKVPAQATLEDIKKAYTNEQQLFKDLGIPDPTQMRREQLDEEIKNAKSEKTQAGWRWLANFGATWAATGGPTLQAMTKSGEKTMPGLMDDIKDINKLQRDQRKELAGLAALDAQAKRDMTAKARDRLNSERARAEDRLDNYNKQITTLGASIGGQLVQRDTSLQVAKIGADSRSADIDAVERRIAAMPGKTYAERLTNYYKAITPRYASETSELDKTAAALAKDPAKLEALKATNPALYAIMIQRINALSVPTATDQATGRVRD
jgi:septal ring factor EnvC (AmiA/AmiB activator)